MHSLTAIESGRTTTSIAVLPEVFHIALPTRVLLLPFLIMGSSQLRDLTLEVCGAGMLDIFAHDQVSLSGISDLRINAPKQAKLA